MRFPNPARPGRRTPGLILAILVLALPGTAAVAQIPDEFTNLKVLPKDIAKGELIGVMRSFAGGLGVRCKHCHPGPDNLQGMDFATDELEHKRVARAMMLMTTEINKTLLPTTKRESLAKVECATCHRGLTNPSSLRVVLLEAVDESGVAEAVKHYRELREKHHGAGSYDFSPGTLNSVAETLAKERRDLDGAIEVMLLNVEFNPDEAYSHLLLGQIYATNGDKAAAIASMKRAIELEPDNRWAKQALEAVQKSE